ncbi:hypothetical protein A7X67_01690 [Clostridium sp. W14A]|uniref:DUF5640 domain-containing protein n=1 Tax=Caproicibacter fermentans TaxID=2576756 RepID=A0A7G8T8U9_9FIRM|nr:hypothetical protein A7X67_01690 [Clostridium sp. W14A]QNK40040.1 hypothetical protein HCR03_15225 [Caproicibacter fermentans]
MKRVISAILLTVFFLTLAGCKPAPPSEPDNLTGRWKDSYGLTEYRFNSDGTMKIEALNLGSFQGTYSVEGSQITIQYKVVIKTVKETYDFRVDGNTLYLDDREFTRKE